MHVLIMPITSAYDLMRKYVEPDKTLSLGLLLATSVSTTLLIDFAMLSFEEKKSKHILTILLLCCVFLTELVSMHYNYKK